MGTGDMIKATWQGGTRERRWNEEIERDNGNRRVLKKEGEE